jgi:hypothetical protein
MKKLLTKLKKINMNKLFRYINGGLIGMCCEYIYRVNNTPIVWGVLFFMLVSMLIDLIDKEI